MFQNPFLYMSLFGLLIKAVSTYRLKDNLKVSGARLCMLLLFLVYAQTVLELLAFYSVVNPSHDILFILKAYYLMLIASILIIPVLFFNILNNRINHLLLLIIVLVFIFMTALLSTDIVIKNAVYTEFTITRVKGDFYWILQVFIIGSLFVTLGSLVYTYKTTQVELTRVKCANLLLAFTLVTFGGVGIIIMMAVKAPATGAGFVPIMFGILFIVMVESLHENYVIDLRTIIPGTKKFSYVLKTIKPILIATNRSCNNEDYLKQYERALMDIADMQFTSQKEKMKFLKKSKATYYRLIKERTD